MLQSVKIPWYSNLHKTSTLGNFVPCQKPWFSSHNCVWIAKCLEGGSYPAPNKNISFDNKNGTPEGSLKICWIISISAANLAQLWDETTFGWWLKEPKPHPHEDALTTSKLEPNSLKLLKRERLKNFFSSIIFQSTKQSSLKIQTISH